MMPLLPGVRRLDVTARDGRSLFYAVTSRGEVMIYRQLWSDGKLIGEATSIDATDSMESSRFTGICGQRSDHPRISIYAKEVLLLEFLFCPFHKPGGRIQR